MVSKMAQFRSSMHGNVAMIFALCVIPFILMLGAAIDFNRQRGMAVQVQAALDNALMNVVHEAPGLSDEELKRRTRAYFDTAMQGKSIKVDVFDVSRAGEEISVSFGGSVPSTMLGLAGIQEMKIGRESAVVAGNKTFEIALALDTTGSMAGDKIDKLKVAAKTLVTNLSTKINDTNRLKFAVVPFANYVNVGPANANQNWMDKQARASYHSEYFDQDVNRFDLYDHLGIAWPGCVESRPYPHDVDDTEPSIPSPDTLFVPMFVPDEIDNQIDYPNTYLPDPSTLTGLAAVRDTAKYGVVVPNVPSGWTPVTVQRTNYGFYSNVTAPQGPDFNCIVRPITPLTSNYASVKTEIDALAVGGSTNMVEGIMWGWRTLSERKPFNEGRLYSEANNFKVIVLLTDGNNEVNGFANLLGSDAFSYGYTENGRLGLTAGATTSEIGLALDARFTEACNNAKAKGIIVYTIRLELGDTRSENLLKACATSPVHFLDVPDADDLDAAFAAIESQLLNLHFSK